MSKILFFLISASLWAADNPAVVSPPVAIAADTTNASFFYLWHRENFESKKTQELSSMLDRLLGPGKAAVHAAFLWPESSGVGDTAASLAPSRVIVTVVLDPKVKVKDLNFIQSLTQRVLDLDLSPAGRGDRLEIYQLGGAGFLGELFYSPDKLFELVKFFVLILLVLVVVSSVLKGARDISVSLERFATEKRTHDIDLTVSPKVPAGVTAPRVQARIQATTTPMGSPEAALIPALSQVDSDTLARVLEDESSRSIALFIATLEPDLASKVLASLAPSKQEEVAITLSQMESEPDPREVAHLQAQIHLKLRKLLLERK